MTRVDVVLILCGAILVGTLMMYSRGGEIVDVEVDMGEVEIEEKFSAATQVCAVYEHPDNEPSCQSSRSSLVFEDRESCLVVLNGVKDDYARQAIQALTERGAVHIKVEFGCFPLSAFDQH